VAAVYAIEVSFRPWWVRGAENAYLVAGFLWWLASGRGFRDVTVGPFQVGCHIVAEYLGIPYTRQRDTWNAPRSPALALGLLKLPTMRYNAELAAFRLGWLWRQALEAGMDKGKAITFVGTWYNGTESYGVVLHNLVRLIDRNT